MRFDCRLYGLFLAADFAPVGVAAAPAGPPAETIAVEIEPLARLAARWSGAATSGAWRGRLRDGAELSIRWGRDDGLLFSYDGERATFLLDREMRRLGCAPAEPRALDWQRVLLSRVLPLVAIARGAEALHAGAVEIAGGVVAVMAPSGGGKSTLVAELSARGGTLVSDDVLVLTAGPDGVRAQPGSPHLSLVDDRSAPGEPLGVLGGKHWLGMERILTEAREVTALVQLDRGAATAPRTVPLPASPLALVPFMLGLPDHDGREADRFELYSDLVATAPLLRLEGAMADTPAALADELERALAERPTAMAEARA